MLTDDEQKTLLALARRTLETVVVEGKKLRAVRLDDLALTPALEERRGAFVTLTGGATGELRGCIGMPEPVEPLYRTVMDSARSAALNDPRFAPVTAAEVPKVRIEISALTPMEPCANPALIEIGVHGLMLEWQGRRGLLLPQVPVEWSWDRDTFLQQLCRKSNVPDKTWKKPDAKLQWFRAQVFGE